MAKEAEVVGSKYGKITVISRLRDAQGRLLRAVIGRCDCGTEVTVSIRNLRNGNTKTCGCTRYSDLIVTYAAGTSFGQLTVISVLEIKPRRKSTYLCACTCGGSKVVSHVNLQKGKTCSCGCMTLLNKPQKDLVGLRSGRLVVLAVDTTRASKGKSSMRWVCACDCGGTTTVTTNAFNSGVKKSCGCLHKPPKDLTGQRFGSLVAQCLVEKTKPLEPVKWLCKCDCGQTSVVGSTQLTKGYSKSCGCLRKVTGAAHPNFNPFLTPEEREVGRNYNAYYEWRKQVKERDDFTCQICGTRGGHLNSHHLNAWHAFPEQRFELTNGATLCKECHFTFHGDYGRKNNTASQYHEFKQNYLAVNNNTANN